MQDSCLSKKADGIQSFADRKDLKTFVDARKTICGSKNSLNTPRISADGTSPLTFVTKKLPWKDGRNTLIVSLIGHHLPMMKLSTDYHSWNVIRCSMSPQLFLSKSNTTPVIWQGSRFRCNTCRDFQCRRSSSCRATETYFTLWENV